MSAAARKTRRAVVDGAEHTDASPAAMKTSGAATLVAAVLDNPGSAPPWSRAW